MSGPAPFAPLLPEIVAPPPGPASRELAQDLARFEAPGINTLPAKGEPPIVWREALGSNVWDVDGNRYLDFTSGFGAAAVGHRHPRVVEAIRRQSESLLHGLGDVAAHPMRIELARRLAALAPVDDPQVYFAISGADAIEIATKTVALATGRPGLLVFDPGYHGTTAGALAATSRRAFREPFARQLNPHVRRLPFGVSPAQIDNELAERAELGAVLLEPIVGREGVIVPPAGWLRAVARIVDEQGRLLVVDEIFTGFGRTGAQFVVEEEGVRPDLLCCGKALGGGLPIGAVVGRRALLESWRSEGEALHTATFVAHPLACAAALAVLDLLAKESLAQRAKELGAVVERALTTLRARGAAAVTAIRGRGLLWGIELDRPATAKRFADAALALGVLVLAGGAEGRVVQIAPPLSIAETQLAAGLELLLEVRI